MLIDLGNDNYIVKFQSEDNKNKVLHEGPWFMDENFISVRKWEPNFVPKKETITHTATWARLPQLPTEFYDKQVLERVGEKLGTLLKMDTCTSATLRRRYARICVQVVTNTPVKSEITIGKLRQKVLYEGDGILCISCGKVGHTRGACETIPVKNTIEPHPKNTINTNQADIPNGIRQSPEEAWEIVTFPKEHGQNQHKAQTHTQLSKPIANRESGPLIQFEGAI